MVNNVFKKYLVIGVILLFLGASVLTGSGGNYIYKSNKVEYLYPGDSIVRLTLYVDDDYPDCNNSSGNKTNPYCNISAALKKVEDLDHCIILVANGTYSENIVIDKNKGLILKSLYEYSLEEGENIGDLYGDDIGKPIINGSGVGNVIGIYSDYVQIIGFKIINSGPLNGAGIYIHYGHQPRIYKNTIENCHTGINMYYTKYLQGEFNEVEKNIIRYNEWGIYLHRTLYLRFKNNHIENNVWGFVLEAARYNEIEYNEISNHSMAGMFLGLSYYNIIRRNNFRNNSNHVLMRNSRNEWQYNYWDTKPSWLNMYIFVGIWYPYSIGRPLPILLRFDWNPSNKVYTIDP